MIIFSTNIYYNFFVGVIFPGVTLITSFGNGFSWHGDGQISNRENMEKNRVKNATEKETDIHIPFL